MVKIVKKKKKLRLEGLITLVFVLSMLSYFISITVIHSQNVILMSQQTQIEKDIEVLENDVANLELDVKQLSNSDRIIEIAKKHGLKVNQEQIVSVQNKE